MSVENVWRRLLVAIGVTCLAMAAGGLWYNANTLSVDYDSTLSRCGTDVVMGSCEDLKFFYPAFYTMSGICILFYLLLTLTGIQLIRLKLWWVIALVAIVIAEVVYFFAVVQFGVFTTYGHSIAAATGVANGGLMFQGITGFIIWAPLAALWARKSVQITVDR